MGEKRVFIKLLHYCFVPHERAKLLSFHHLHQSPVSFDLSQAEPGKSADSLCISNGIVPVDHTGTKRRRPSMEDTGTTKLEHFLCARRRWLTGMYPTTLWKTVSIYPKYAKYAEYVKYVEYADYTQYEKQNQVVCYCCTPPAQTQRHNQAFSFQHQSWFRSWTREDVCRTRRTREQVCRTRR